MFKRVKPTPKEIKETSLRASMVDSMKLLYGCLQRVKREGLTIESMLVLLYLYYGYSSSVKGLCEELGFSYMGAYTIVHRLIGLGYIERVNAYSVILTSKGVLYIESFT